MWRLNLTHTRRGISGQSETTKGKEFNGIKDEHNEKMNY